VKLFDLAGAVDEAVGVVPRVVRILTLPLDLVLKHAVLDSTR